MSVSLRKSKEFDSYPLEAGGIAAGRRHGRGAQTNRSGRFEPVSYEPADDGWELLAELEALTTEVQEVPGAAHHHAQRTRPISASTARSIPIGAASMAASTASRAPPTLFSGSRRGSTSRPGCSPRPMPARRSSASLPIPPIASRPSPSAPIPTPISRSSGATASCAASWKSSAQQTTRSASSPSLLSYCAIWIS